MKKEDKEKNEELSNEEIDNEELAEEDTDGSGALKEIDAKTIEIKPIQVEYDDDLIHDILMNINGYYLETYGWNLIYYVSLINESSLKTAGITRIDYNIFDDNSDGFNLIRSIIPTNHIDNLNTNIISNYFRINNKQVSNRQSKKASYISLSKKIFFHILKLSSTILRPSTAKDLNNLTTASIEERVKLLVPTLFNNSINEIQIKKLEEALLLKGTKGEDINLNDDFLDEPKLKTLEKYYLEKILKEILNYGLKIRIKDIETLDDKKNIRSVTFDGLIEEVQHKDINEKKQIGFYELANPIELSVSELFLNLLKNKVTMGYIKRLQNIYITKLVESDNDVNKTKPHEIYASTIITILGKILLKIKVENTVNEPNLKGVWTTLLQGSDINGESIKDYPMRTIENLGASITNYNFENALIGYSFNDIKRREAINTYDTIIPQVVYTYNNLNMYNIDIAFKNLSRPTKIEYKLSMPPVMYTDNAKKNLVPPARHISEDAKSLPEHELGNVKIYEYTDKLTWTTFMKNSSANIILPSHFSSKQINKK